MKSTNKITFTVVTIAMTAAMGIKAEEQTDTAKVHELKEVTVTESMESLEGDHVVLKLSNANRKYGTNALDAVSSLNRFQTNLNGTELYAWDQSKVFILINGVPSSSLDLRSYKGADIKNVEYYSVAPPQYMMLTQGPVANIVIKKRHDRQYSGYFNTKNSVLYKFGYNQAVLTYADSLNQVKVGYFLNYRDTRHIDIHSEYDYAPDRKTQYNDRQRYKGEYHNWIASYQRFQGSHLFNAKLTYTTDPGYERQSGTGSIYDGTGTYNGTSSRLLKSRSNAAALNLYYGYTFSGGKSIAINVVNTIGRSHSDSHRSLLFSDPYSQLSYNVTSGMKNRTYSLIGSASYSMPLLGGYLTAGSRYEYTRLSQDTRDTKYTPQTHTEFLYTGLSIRKNDFTIYPAIGIKIADESTGTMNRTTATPYIRFYGDWWPQNNLKGFTTQLTLSHMDGNPPLNLLTGNYTYIDAWMVSTGNPSLKNFSQSSAKLDIAYYHPDGRNSVALRIMPIYYRNSSQQVLMQQDGYAILQHQNIKHDFYNRFYLKGSWYPVKWLEFSPSFSVDTYRYDTPSQKVRRNYCTVGCLINLTFDKWEVSLDANSPIEQYSGDLTIHGSAQYAAIVQYKYRGWSFGAEYHYLGHNEYTKGTNGSFSYCESKNLPTLRYLCQVTATYSFSIGRARRHARQRLNESSSETGLDRYNKASMPE